MSDNSRDIKLLVTKLSEIKVLLEQNVAINLYAHGATQKEIAENLHIRIAKVNGYVKGMKKTKSNDPT